MKPPCELVVSKILPAIRASLVKILINEHKMKQKQVANLLNITQASVSQYNTATRGYDRELLDSIPEIKEYAGGLCEKIMNEKKAVDLKDETCRICKSLRQSRQFQDYWEKITNGPPCDICD